MDLLLERLKLIDYLITELPIEKKVFIERLRRNVDQGDTGVFLSLSRHSVPVKANIKV